MKSREGIYLSCNKESIETWLRNVIVLIPKKVCIERLEGQTRGICVPECVCWPSGTAGA